MIKWCEVIEEEKLGATLTWLQNQESTRMWARSIGITASSMIHKNGTVYFVVDEDGDISCTSSRPAGTEMILEYVRHDWQVTKATYKRHDLVEIDGKQYYADEVRELLKGLEVGK